jgi:hypothetical protein
MILVPMIGLLIVRFEAAVGGRAIAFGLTASLGHAIP